MRKISDFFTRHKIALLLAALLLLLLALYLLWSYVPRPLLSGRDLREAQNETISTIRVWQYIDGEPVDVTNRLDHAALVERLANTRCIRFFGAHDGVLAGDLRYEIDISLSGSAIHLPLGVPEPYLSTNHAYRSGNGSRTVWRVLDYEQLIADLDAMLSP